MIDLMRERDDYKEQLEAAGAVWGEHEGTYLQTHLSETKREIEDGGPPRSNTPIVWFGDVDVGVDLEQDRGRPGDGAQGRQHGVLAGAHTLDLGAPGSGGLYYVSLLNDLHQKHGMTLVMVTHDVHLKAFADRVVWMRDGRIQRIEVVPAHRGFESTAELLHVG